MITLYSGDFGVDQGRIMREGEKYLKSEHPLLDYIRACTLLTEQPGMNLPPASQPASRQFPEVASSVQDMDKSIGQSNLLKRIDIFPGNAEQQQGVHEQQIWTMFSIFFIAFVVLIGAIARYTNRQPRKALNNRQESSKMLGAGV